MGRLRWLALVPLALAAACSMQPAPPPSQPVPAARPPATPGADQAVLNPASFADLPGWREDNVADVLPALLKSCDRLAKQPREASVGPMGRGGIAAEWGPACQAARNLTPGDNQAARAFFQAWFTPWQVTNRGEPVGLFTGYYEPELNGRRERSASFTVPILGRPADLITADLAQFDMGHGQLAGRVVNGKLVPYPKRADIEAGNLGSLAQPLLWVEDPVDAHILHIQGSGRVRLDDGSVVRVGVAATNGHKFVGIGKILAEKGKIEAGGSMPSIRAWLKAHPDEARSLMAGNPRYIFYHFVNGDGPVGAAGVALTPGRSLAVDPRYLPLGAPLWLDTTQPSGAPVRRAVVAQDTGAAITGVVRGDFFWGSGDGAFEQAGRMKSQGRYWLLLPRTVRPQ